MYVGEKVRVIDSGKQYTTFLRFLADNILEIGNEHLKKFRYGREITDEEMNDEFTVEFIAKHPTYPNNEVAVITNGTYTYIFGTDGLASISEVKVGDEVYITDVGEVYSCFEKFMFDNYSSIGTSVFWDFKYGAGPKDDKTIYRVAYVAKHPDKNDKLAIVQLLC